MSEVKVKYYKGHFYSQFTAEKPELMDGDYTPPFAYKHAYIQLEQRFRLVVFEEISRDDYMYAKENRLSKQSVDWQKNYHMRHVSSAQLWRIEPHILLTDSHPIELEFETHTVKETTSELYVEFIPNAAGNGYEGFEFLASKDGQWHGRIQGTGYCAITTEVYKDDSITDAPHLPYFDILPLSLGIKTAGGVFTKIIEANTPIPAKKSKEFTTVEDNQSSVKIEVFQGERPLVRDNRKLGEFNLHGIPPHTRGVPKIEVTFEIDPNGKLTVFAKNKSSEKFENIRVEPLSGLTQVEVDRIKHEAIANADLDKKAKEEAEQPLEKDQRDQLLEAPKGCLNSGCTNIGCLKGGCSKIGCGILGLLLLLLLLMSLLRACSDKMEQLQPPRIIHDTVYLDEKSKKEIIKRFKDTTTISKTEAIELPNVQFYTNSANLLLYSYKDIQQLADYMVNHTNLHATIIGHTDNVGDASANLNLSQARAERVKQVLQTYGVDVGRIDAIGMGESEPRATNETLEGRALNRRVEVRLSNTEEIKTKSTEIK